MESINDATPAPKPRTGEDPPAPLPPPVGFTLARNGALYTPSLSKINSMPHFARRWHELHPAIPLTPLRRVGRGPEVGGDSPSQLPWEPLEGWWDGLHSGREVVRLLKADPSLGIGLRLGRRGPGLPWLVAILVRDVKESRPSLGRMLDRDDRDCVAGWRAEEGKNWVFVGDDRLEGLGPLVVGAFQGNGGNPHYAGLEIRLGSDDPATSLVVLPPTPLGNGKRRVVRMWTEWFSTLPVEA